MKKVYLFEINDILTNQAKVPYSTGLIWSYCSTLEEISDNFELEDVFWYRQPNEIILSKIKDPAVVGFSCFVWNWKNNIQLAKEIKEQWPNCLIVFGGWQVPMSDRCHGFFKLHPYVDVAVHGEGEITFSNILIESLKSNPDWSKVKGCSVPRRMITNSFVNHKIDYGLKVIEEDIDPDLDLFDTVTNLPQPRIENLSSMPSPYLDGLFNRLVIDCKYELEATIETTRGCPYSCTYCEIGTKYYQKIKTQTLEKVFAEIDWISANKVVFVYNADSNFGMMKDHLEITKYLVDKKKNTGYPQKHRCDWSKNQADKVVELARIFYEAKMDKGITIALQSMNPHTLDAIKRKNVDGGKLKEFLELYDNENLPSYIELILGLPEETKDSFVNGICKVMDLGQHNYIGIYPLTALPNTPFGDPEYLNKYGLKIVETMAAFSHIDVSEVNDFEREHMIVSSNTMTKEEYIECTVWRWLFMFGHYLGSTQYIARFVNVHTGTSFKNFYSSLKQYIESKPESFLGQELVLTKNSLKEVLEATHPWGRVLADVRANFAWDFEEATVMKISQNRAKFSNDMFLFLKKTYSLEDNLVKDILLYQDYGTVDPFRSYPTSTTFSYNIHTLLYLFIRHNILNLMI